VRGVVAANSGRDGRLAEQSISARQICQKQKVEKVVVLLSLGFKNLEMNNFMPPSNDSGYQEDIETDLASQRSSNESPDHHHNHHQITKLPDREGSTSPDGGDNDSCQDYDEYPPINQRVDVGLSDQELVTLSTKELNRMLKKKGITKERAKEIKRERRTLKNRGYAANCRVKREDEEKTLEQENERLCRLITHHRMHVEKTKKETELMKQRFAKGQEELRILKEQEEIYRLKVARLRREADQQNQALHIQPPASILSNLPDIQFQRVEEGNETRKSSEIKLITLP